MPYIITTSLYPSDIAPEVAKRYLEAIQKYPGSLGAANCQALIHQIEAKHLQLTLENVTVRRSPSRSLSPSDLPVEQGKERISSTFPWGW